MYTEFGVAMSLIICAKHLSPHRLYQAIKFNCKLCARFFFLLSFDRPPDGNAQTPTTIAMKSKFLHRNGRSTSTLHRANFAAWTYVAVMHMRHMSDINWKLYASKLTLPPHTQLQPHLQMSFGILLYI